jgi:hypothetical protein
MNAMARAAFTLAARVGLALGGPQLADAVPIVLAQSHFDARDEGSRVTTSTGDARPRARLRPAGPAPRLTYIARPCRAG